ncbi:TonB-dependent receptor [Novosphingobium sp. 1949]|uniref:TonB-dependent receptor n=1 Tax=Novosphingobium organovorum TaxID=2930092 RepID=A0ABT0BIZ6_9SPHN|nr:TonB-dependent receptor [Novosphingobium organovorum]MCJ2184943.1 TonB-dependent receptor [Novosphingobium organovorum]
MRKVIFGLTGIISAQLLLATSVQAQDEGAGKTARPAAQQPEGEIVVTALRRSTTVQSTPLSIVALGSQDLAQTGSTQLNDYFRQIPNLNVTSSVMGSSRISIRGINAAGEATVGLYYDETPVTGPSGTTQDSGAVAADLNLYDVERVEVLRGPQGTLYGASSMAGTLRVIFNKPNYDEYEASSEAQVTSTKGGNAGYFVRGMVNAPIVADTLAVRVVGYYEKKPGYIDNVTYGTKNINDSTNWGLRGLIGWKPDDATTVTGTVVYQRGKADDQQGWYPSVGHYKTDSAAQLPFTSKMQLYNLKAERDLGFATLTGTGSYYDYSYIRTYDFSPIVTAYSYSTAACAAYYGQSSACSSTQMSAYTANGLSMNPVVLYQPAYVHSQTYEARLSSNEGRGPSWLDWTVGFYYESRKDHIDSNSVSEDATDGSLIYPIEPLSYRYVETHERQIAGFGEASVKPVDGLTLTAGTRYYDYRKTTLGESYITNVYTGSSQADYSSATTNANGWLAKFNVSYQITPTLMVYTSASKGFRPGGVNNIPGLAANLVSYKADSLWDYEVGVKSSWLDNALVFNATVFDIEWSNMQTSATTADGAYAFLTNAGHARAKGFEVDMTARPYMGVTLKGALGYTDAHLTEDQSSDAVLITSSTGLAGDRIPNTPDWTASASAAYNWALTSQLGGLLRADFAYTGKQQSAFHETAAYYNAYGDYATLNLRAGVEGDRWGAYLFVNNVTDTTGNVAVASGYGYSGLTFSITPRTVGLNLSYKM